MAKKNGKVQAKNEHRNVGPVRVKSTADLSEAGDLLARCDEMVENRCEVFIHNVDYLCKKNNLTQGYLCDHALGGFLKSPQLTSYKHAGKDIPIRTMGLIAAYFNETIESMCGTLLDEPQAAANPTLTGVTRPITECNKYLGTYDLAYFDTSEPVGRNTKTTARSLNKGILTVYPGNAVNGAATLQVVAFVNCSEEELAKIHAAIKSAQEQNTNPDYRACYQYVAEHSRVGADTNRMKCLYEGKLELTDRVAEATLRQACGSDVVHMVAHNRAAASASGKPYRGGLATMMSVSRGAEHMPCIQSVIISKRGFSNLSAEALANYLYMCPPQVEVKECTEKIISYMRMLYTAGEESPISSFSEDDKRYCLESFAEKQITDAMRRNLLSYYKVSVEMDYMIYKAVCGEQSAD